MLEVLKLLENRLDREGRLARHYLGYPDSLPNLSLLKPPGGNTKPEGIDASFYVHRHEGRLPTVY
jgi:hypothetical protein